MRNLITIWVCAAIAALLAGCAGGSKISADRLDDEMLQKRFIGKSKDYLLGCAGSPGGTRTDVARTHWTYNVDAHTTTRDGTRQSGSCKINFAMRRDIIDQVTMSASGPEFNRNIACNRIVAACR